MIEMKNQYLLNQIKKNCNKINRNGKKFKKIENPGNQGNPEIIKIQIKNLNHLKNMDMNLKFFEKLM